ncbi:Na+/H+ antiporter subunit E [Roseobacter denitrificans]|uniref:pH adaption potassium efflux system protein n=1 Tax=Roseobacter denitrificans (strain ATCC 33942 / OCh 114) TaxID=375451 RepID=Q162R3_ROSDO|nr:Na+/H+ antiporter subunit E [Roseobacter denitrificans]ABG33030.1 pH adaption potassium efflux system protein [Roseobacter denitrificans OCh 114]AVL52407.1 Na+/H+ antiporter subunit E [Roseobacter denitrificans]SFG09221.1 multisubunit potassium/proton antiporter, PhaE subunit [Roseobacter denitrificans OCh 114]
MGRALHWLFPHPLLTVILTIVWIMLQNEVSAGMFVFGVILGIIIPRATAVWWPGRPESIRAGKFLVYCLIVLWDIIVANIEVAWIILTKSNAKLKPKWVEVPLDLRQPEAITILAGTITLTPGTVSADLSNEGRSLLVHALDAEDANAVRDEIKNRYERRLKEIFQ